jgi:hypothetical protein
MNEIASLYSKSQQGGELPYFVGKQYGSGWLRTIARMAFPILKRFGLAASNVAGDVIMKNKSILPSIKTHGMDALGSTVGELVPQVTKLFKRQQPVQRKSSMNKRRKVHGTIFNRK